MESSPARRFRHSDNGYRCPPPPPPASASGESFGEKGRRPHPDLVVDASVLGVLVKLFLRVDGDLMVQQPLPDLVGARQRLVLISSDLQPVRKGHYATSPAFKYSESGTARHAGKSWKTLTAVL